ncbi:ferritin family protein [Clostridium sp. FP2]|uniref:ferritin family protein n=1 Tax=Clostridium TaxID=1485 RepID=UPI0013E8FE5A|nr:MULTISPECIES: ferritin family protein [Clostridium]MBW9156340.1 ferritin family protein [Clostridium tagluense]MBZ9624371.1 ferritin family protein [Clostridium sp. FP2]WLC64247.1 ferritin family protein [Clostridium tagluense]
MNNQELMIVKQAIINEIEGYEFYNMAANNSSSAEVKNAFLELAQEEMQHVVWLKDLFNKVKDDNVVDFQLALIPEPTSPAIFKWENLDRKDAGIAVSAFGIGIQMEKASIEYYAKAAKETGIKEAKELFNILIKWEKIHLDKFSLQYEELKEEWWSEQGYAPF